MFTFCFIPLIPLSNKKVELSANSADSSKWDARFAIGIKIWWRANWSRLKQHSGIGRQVLSLVLRRVEGCKLFSDWKAFFRIFEIFVGVCFWSGTHTWYTWSWIQSILFIGAWSPTFLLVFGVGSDPDFKLQLRVYLAMNLHLSEFAHSRDTYLGLPRRCRLLCLLVSRKCFYELYSTVNKYLNFNFIRRSHFPLPSTPRIHSTQWTTTTQSSKYFLTPLHTTEIWH